MPIVIVDTDLSNLKSLSRAISLVSDKEIIISQNPKTIETASHVILPGVGAFGRYRETLIKTGCINALRSTRKAGTPILGICLGMQILASNSSEFGMHQGLNFIPGVVRPLPKETMRGKKIKTTHIGWSRLISHSQHQILDNFSTKEAFYFVHSYVFRPTNSEDILASIDFGGKTIPVLIGKNKVFGCQFHPEKSGETGLRFISAFLNE